MTDPADALSEGPDGTRIAIEVSAGAKTEAFPAGYNEWRRALGCRVTAPALEGRANKAVMALVAQRLGCPPSSVSIIAGATSSQKTVFVSGMKRDAVLLCLKAALAG